MPVWYEAFSIYPLPLLKGLNSIAGQVPDTVQMWTVHWSLITIISRAIVFVMQNSINRMLALSA